MRRSNRISGFKPPTVIPPTERAPRRETTVSRTGLADNDDDVEDDRIRQDIGTSTFAPFDLYNLATPTFRQTPSHLPGRYRGLSGQSPLPAFTPHGGASAGVSKGRLPTPASLPALPRLHPRIGTPHDQSPILKNGPDAPLPAPTSTPSLLRLRSDGHPSRQAITPRRSGLRSARNAGQVLERPDPTPEVVDDAMSEDGNSEYDLSASSDEDDDQDFGEDEADCLWVDVPDDDLDEDRREEIVALEELAVNHDQVSDGDTSDGGSEARAADGSTAGDGSANDYWDPDEYDAIDLGQVKKPDPVDPNDVARFQERVKYGVGSGYADAHRRFRYFRTGDDRDKTMALSVASMYTRLGADRIAQGFLDCTPDYVQAAHGKPGGFNEAAFKGIPRPTAAMLSAYMVYGAMTKRRGPGRRRIGRYHGSGTAVRRGRGHRRGGGGQRLQGYLVAKRSARRGVIMKKLLEEDGRTIKGRHLSEALRPDVDWSIRVLTIAPPGTPRALVLIYEGIWVHIERTLTSSLPREGSAAANFQNQASVDSSRRAVRDYEDPPYFQLNGASPNAQGAAESAAAVRKIIVDEVGGIGVCYEQPLPNPEAPGRQSQFAISTIPSILGKPIHCVCSDGWRYRVQKNPDLENDVAAGKEYCEHRRELGGFKDRGRHKLVTLRKRRAVKLQGNKCGCGCGDTKFGRICKTTWMVSTGQIPGVAAGVAIFTTCKENWDAFVKRNPAAANDVEQAAQWKASRANSTTSSKEKKLIDMDWTCPCGCGRSTPPVMPQGRFSLTWGGNPLPGIPGAFVLTDCGTKWRVWLKEKGKTKGTLEDVRAWQATRVFGRGRKHGLWAYKAAI